MKIAIQGIEGCYHQLAAMKYFGNDLKVLPCMTFPELVNKVEHDKNCDGGIMAIENSIAGNLLQNNPLLLHSDLCICGEVAINIEHHFLALKGQSIRDIKIVRSHPMAIKQCYTFLNKLKDIKVIEAEDTALSAKRIAARKEPHTAAIASSICTSLYGLDSLGDNIQDEQENYTRFLILKKRSLGIDLESGNKASICFQLKNSVGTLAKVLNYIADRNINISQLQSYPIASDKWQYYYFVDLVFPTNVNKEKTFEKLREMTTSFRVQGVYKQMT